MDSFFSQPEQASDQSLFSQKTDTISETYSTCSPADTPSVGDGAQKLPHSSQASQCLSDGTPGERLQVIPETEELSPQDDGLTGSCPPGSPQNKAPGSTTDVRKDFATDSKPADSSCAQNVPTDDWQSPDINDGNSGLKTRDSGIGSEQRSSTLLDGGISNHSVQLPAGVQGESTHRRIRLLDDSDDDSTSDLKLPESKSATDAEQRDSTVPDGDASNLKNGLEVPPSALGGYNANKPRRIRLLDDSDDDSTSDLKLSESKSDADAERRDSAVPDDAPSLNGSLEVPAPSALGGDSANKPRRLRLLDDSDDDSTSEPISRGVELASNSDAVRGGDSGTEHSRSPVRRRICDSSDDEMVDDVAGDSTRALGDENSCGPWVPDEDGESAGNVTKKERTGRKSAKKAMEELKQIYSTSQRMARERRMSLPYHEPERLSLKDFLQQRRSAGSESNSACKKEEETAMATLPSSSSTDPLLDDLPAVLTTPNGVGDQECAEEPAMTEATPSEKQPAETSLSSNGVERIEMQHLSARRRRNLEAIAAGIVPRLSKEPVILLEDDNGDHCEGVDHLLKRLVKHTKVDDPKKKKESIKTSAIVVPGVIEECSISEKLVSQRSLLKEKLLSKVRQQRNRSREQRYLQHCLDNEELPPDAVRPDDAPKSPLALADEFEEEENDFSDANDTSSGGEEEDDKNSDDEDVVLKHKKRTKRINPLSDDEDQEDAEDTKKTSAGNAEDEDDDSIGELHLEMPAFLDAEDNVDQPATGDEDCMESFLDSSQVANSDKNSQTPLIRKSSAVHCFQPDETELFSPLTGLPRTQSKTNTPQQGNASASSSFQESPVYSTISRPRSLAFSPLTGTAGALTACRSLRRQLSEDYTKPWDGSTPAPVNPSQDMDELVGLCSGSFGARAQADQIDEDEEDNDMLEASPDEPNEEDVETDSEVEGTPAAREQPALKLQDFFEDEAELSGSDVGSDGEDEDDDEGVLADLIATENEKEDTDKIREEIGRFHFKQLLDEDKRELKIYQELLLEDGDLHSDGAGRQRQFRWRNSGTDDLDQRPGSDGEEEAHIETEQEADATWRLQRLERRRWLQEQESTESPDTPDSASFSEQESLLRAPTAIAKQDLKFSNKPAAKKGAMCGSFLKLDSGVLGRIAERIKGAAPTEVEGSVTTKNFVFRAAEEKPKKRPSTSQPSQESKKPKLVELSEQRELKISVFNFM
ncbi:uncharacterized protein [Dermacentor andersoni]|uniref:uncharacterized protein isoform X3 n=1 Tax=Dermacentor andersoni TaxID=34620 RepID=UPI002415A5D1|nr:claspin-like isoform X3 [Dermacentor andersoni]